MFFPAFPSLLFFPQVGTRLRKAQVIQLIFKLPFAGSVIGYMHRYFSWAVNTGKLTLSPAIWTARPQITFLLVCMGLYMAHSLLYAPTLLPVEIGAVGQSGDTDFLQPSLRDRLSLSYSDLEFGTDTTTLNWLYSPDPMSLCAASTYQVDAYSQDEVSTASQRDIRAIFRTQTTQRTLAVNSSLVRSPGSTPNYFKVSASNNCATSAYLHDLFLNG
jgi:hypothetical protein